ncbi:MAG: VCBS repeat-containing protein [Phycisphaerae bacterium]
MPSPTLSRAFRRAGRKGAAAALIALHAAVAASAVEPAWNGDGDCRILIRVDPVDIGNRAEDELVARWSLNGAELLKTLGESGRLDPASLQVQRYDPKTGSAEPFRAFETARSRFDRPCRFEDHGVPANYPDRVGAASDAADGRPRIMLRPRGGRLFNREMTGDSGDLVWVHTQRGREPSYYAVYWRVRRAGEPIGPAPAPWIGDADLFRRPAGQPINGMSHHTVCVADFNGDGLFDLFAGVEKGQLMFFPNHGSIGRPRFSGCRMLTDEDGPIDAGWYCNPFVTDWDGDDLPDVLVGTMHDVIVWWKNTGTRTEPRLAYRGFVLADGKVLKVPASPVAEDAAGIFKVDYFNAPTVCDWDHDGRPDLLTGGYTTGRIYFYRNVGRQADGTPNLQYVGPLEADGGVLDVGWSATPTAYDFDADGRLELITGSWDFQRGHNPDTYLMYYKNVGSPDRPRLERRPFPKTGDFPKNIIARAAVADWNADGLPDLLVADHNGTTSVLLNQGTRAEPRWRCDGSAVTGDWCFVPLNLSQGPEDYSILTYDYMITAMARLGTDGLVDVLSGDEVHTFQGSPNSPRLVRRGELTVNGKPLLNPGPGYGDLYNWNIVTDWDRDGAPDVLCGTQQGNVFFHRNTGDPRNLSYAPGAKLKLTTGEELKVGPPVHDDPKKVKDFVELQGSRIKMVVADVDADGIDDLVATETYGNVWVFRNTRPGGTDTLAPGVKAIVLKGRARINVIDWNADGKPDLIDGSSTENPGAIHLNASSPGKIAFAPPISPLKLPWMFYGAGFFPRDWNGDGDEDLLVQCEFYLFWAERSFIEHEYRPAAALGKPQRRSASTPQP